MLINIRGTSGSGKSTIVRSIMSEYTWVESIRIEGRKQPISYLCSSSLEEDQDLMVVGHYETDCGGCDTISKMDDIFDLIRRGHHQGNHVLFEGLLISADVNRVAALHDEGLPLLVLAIDLPLDECLESINTRRRAKAERTGKEYKGDVNSRNTVSKHRGVQLSMARLTRLGIANEMHTRQGCLDRVLHVLDL